MAGIALAAYMNKEKLKQAYEAILASGEDEISKLSEKSEELVKNLGSNKEDRVQLGLKALLYVRQLTSLSEKEKI